MQVHAIISNDVTRDQENDNLNAIKRSRWNKNDDSAFSIKYKPRDLSPLSSSHFTDLPQKKYCYTRQHGDNIHPIFKELKQLSEPKTPIVDTENNIVDLVISHKIARHRPVRSKSDSHNAISPSAGATLATLPMACLSNATGASAPSV